MSDHGRAVPPAELMRVQADLFERTVRTARRPTEIAKGLAGVRRRDR